MDQDIMTLTVNSVGELVGNNIAANERTAVAEWLRVQLETERKEWRKKMQVSMKEIERERKSAAVVYEIIPRLLAKFQPFATVINLHTESTYYSSDIDYRTQSLTDLEKNIDAILTILNKYTTDSILQMPETHSEPDSQDSQYGTLEEETSQTVEAMKLKISALQDKLESTENDTCELEKRLTREIKNLEETLALQERFFNEERERNTRRTADLKAVVSQLKCKLRHFQEIKKSKQARLSKSIQVNMAPEVGEASVQVELFSSDHTTLPDVTADKHHNTVHASVLHHDVIDMDSRLTARNKNMDSFSKSLASRNKTGASEGKHFKVTKSLSLDMAPMFCDVTRLDHRQASQHLQRQVVEFADKLEKAKAEMELYHNQIEQFRKINGVSGNLLNQTWSEESPELNGTWDVHCLGQTSPDYSNTSMNMMSSGVAPIASPVAPSTVSQSVDLSSLPASHQTNHVHLGSNALHAPCHSMQVSNGPTRKSRDRQLVLKLRAINSKHAESPDSTKLGRSNKTKAKCLRCHETYEPKDNNSDSCRYHPKKRSKLERYDAKGKMIKMNYIWECCLQSHDAPGCIGGQHV